MQRPDLDKRRQILGAATQLFAVHPFHEVLLDDVAAAAKVGKGTLYIYFKSKEDLYLTLIREGFNDMVNAAEINAGDPSISAWDRLREVVGGLVRFGTQYPDLYRVMRSGQLTPDDEELQRTRLRLSRLVESIIACGIRKDQMVDPHPEITAQFVLSFVRGALLYPAADMTPSMLEEHVLRVLRRGIGTAGVGGTP